MSIVGLGFDLVKISRIKKIMDYYKDKLAKFILSKKEFYSYENNNNPVNFLAKRFAAKEAVLKSLGIGIYKIGFIFNQIQILNDDFGKPNVFLYGKIRKYSYLFGVKNFYLSLSDEDEYACAFVLAEG